MELNELENKIKNGSKDLNDHISLGALYFQVGEYDKLLYLYDQTLKLQLSALDEGRIYYERAESFQLLNRIEEAISAFKDAISVLEQQENTWEALYIICNSYYNLYLQCLDNAQLKHYFDKAEVYYKLAIKKYPNHQELHYLCSTFADLYMRNNEYEKALFYYDFAIDQNPDAISLVQYLCGMASVYARKSDFIKAISYFEKAIKTATKSSINTSKIHFDIGEMYYSMEFSKSSLKKSKDNFSKALQLKDNDLYLKNNAEYELQIHWYLGRIAYEINNSEQAVEIHFRKVLDLLADRNHPLYSSSHLSLGHFFLGQGNIAKAKDHYNEVLLSPLADNEQMKIARECLSQLSLGQ
jgi:tetratricopeptide (TPR) repeat protein